MHASLLSEVRSIAEGEGVNLCGLVDAPSFDRSQPPDRRASRLLPGCGTVLAFASGGRSFWDRALRSSAEGSMGRGAGSRHPVELHESRCLSRIAKHLADRGLIPVVVRPGSAPLNFAQLAEAAGFGTVSPVSHVLLHPTYGAWLCFRAALLFQGHPFGEIESRAPSPWDPCSSCSKPCVSACPAGSCNDGHEVAACNRHRTGGVCDEVCHVRRACPIGAEHRYSPEQESYRQACGLLNRRKPAGLFGFLRRLRS
ncbi:MAG: 4Fe-4S dicluster domain-containing protein [Planctomycetota bacterium]